MANEYLKRTPTSTGNRKVFTFSVWYKRLSDNGGSDSRYFIIAGDTHINLRGSGASNPDDIVTNQRGASTNYFYHYAPARRDYSSWQHLLYAVDTTQTTEKNRGRVYINGVEQLESSSIGSSNAPLNDELSINKTVAHFISEDGGDDGTYVSSLQLSDAFLVDGQALTPDVFGYYKKGDGYISAGSAQATDFKKGQWVPKAPKVIKSVINARGGFGVNGFYLPMNDASNFGADFHCEPNSIIKLKGEDFNEYPQPRNGAPETTDAYVSQLRTDPYAANLVLAVPGIDSNTNPELVTNGDFSNGTTGWIALSEGSISVEDGKLKITETSGVNPDAYACNSTAITTEIGKTYTIKWTFTEGTNLSFTVRFGNSGNQSQEYQSNSATGGSFPSSGSYAYTFTATATTLNLSFIVNQSGTYGYLSNVSVKEAVPVRDYSADIKGSGTNRTPTLDKCGVTSPVPSYYGSAISTGGAGDYLYYDLDGTDYGTNDFTFECWFYAIEEPSNWGILMKHATNGSWANGITLNSKNNTTRTFAIYTHNGSSNFTTASSTVWELNQWHHVVAERYNNTLTLYVNGVAHATRDVTGHNYNVAGTPASSAQYSLSVGSESSSNYQSNGYFNDVRVYKGVAKYKGGFDVPKPYTPVGIGTWRAVPDCTANNFATLNPLDAVTSNQSGTDYTQATHSNGNLTVILSDDFSSARGSIGISSGKYYWEVRLDDNTNSPGLGVIAPGNQLTSYSAGGGGASYEPQSDRFRKNGVGHYDGTNNKTDDGLIVGVALDKDAGSISFYADGALLSNGTMTGLNALSDVHIPECFTFNDGPSVDNTFTWNFGQNPTFSGNTTAGTYTDSNGKGLFKYEPPSGFLALCEDNLPTPAIKNPGEHFKTVLYTGSSSGRSITGIGFTPDLVWIKDRDTSVNHVITDSVRGFNNVLKSNATTGDTNATDTVLGNSSDGFTLGDSGGSFSVNISNRNYVAWCWKAGGAAVSNTDGSIDSVVSVNQDAGFSIATYTATGSTGSIGHGLGKTPAFVITKHRNLDTHWRIWHKGLSGYNYTLFFNTAGEQVQPAYSALPTDSVINLAGDLTGSYNFVTYCWAEIEGFSKFGSYVGNNSADGPFVYCGFKPAWVMIRAVDSLADWVIMDSSRSSTNPNRNLLYANTSGIEQDGIDDRDPDLIVDFLSNGFKCRSTNNDLNNAETYIFAAFAESPFQTANAK
jgi:hypothetical protein